VSPIPGPSAAAAALSASGFAGGRFLFAGFLPASGAERRRQLEALDAPLPVVLYEAPHRVQRTLEELRARLGDAREVVVARELSKKFEQVARLPLGAARAWLEADPARLQGEFVLVLAPGGDQPDAAAVDPERVLELLLGELSPSDAARLAAKICGVPKNALYQKALASKARARGK
ncbi:MAG TPA: SAM-dependent methyltransferase, partial [Burkholderiales bacterium]|nr:SAM-dependent methyltransferase [Burkholderiales bacterium]